ncbi:MAG TPA: hypothetical protein VGM10_06880 [Actinocrinis sp.]
MNSLRETISQERARLGRDVTTLERILERIGDPVTIVDAELQRDPEYQAQLSRRLASASALDGPQEPILDDLAELLTPASAAGPVPVSAARAVIGGATGATGPEICLDPDPFAPNHSVETVGALAEANATMFPAGGPEPEQFEEESAVAAEVSQFVQRARTAWRFGPRVHPWEALSIALFVVGAMIGFWILLLVAGLVACTSRFFSEVEKWTLVVGVPVTSVLLYALGFWLFKHGVWGGHDASTADLLSGAASFFGTLPRMAAVLAALFLSWRLARGVTRQQ